MAVAYYFDSSALLKPYFLEPGTEAVLALLAQGGPHHVSYLTIVEFQAACARRLRDGQLTRDDHDAISVAFDEDILRPRYRLLQPTPTWFKRARKVLVDLGQRHPLRSLDALHIAAALLIREREPEIVLVTSDTRLLTSAQAAGLAVLDPTVGGHGR